MNPTSSASSPRPSISAAEWDKIRLEFKKSLMVNTSLAALAENIDGCAWPLRSAFETPSSYIDLSHNEALARLRGIGLPAATLEKLVVILRGTLAFDESFGEMVSVAGQAESDHDPVPRNLERLGIPLDFPIDLCQLGPGTLEFCRKETITVIEDFLAFSREASRSLTMGDEFRDVLNAISHADEDTIARYLPFRRKASGLYLIEGLALLVRDLPEDQKRKLVRSPETLSAELRAQGTKLAEYFAPQLEEMRASLKAGTPIVRLVAPLNDLALEPVVAAVLRLYLMPNAPEKRGFVQRLLASLGLAR